MAGYILTNNPETLLVATISIGYLLSKHEVNIKEYTITTVRPKDNSCLIQGCKTSNICTLVKNNGEAVFTLDQAVQLIYSVKCSDVTSNTCEWLLNEIFLYKIPSPYFIVLASSLKLLSQVHPQLIYHHTYVL